ncbi:ferritin-like domain-containing protein [Granulicella sibirica]|uniref:Dessication-associated protein n=1 Tax=Granulicella sibirica TaxID=2479048 RepID=A0A4Q0T1R8_9BACT|nr:ferritin-like domain-containing protein [Granulicella sibirica]RXH55491.1 dessication-associated protein [Granulicella sibirica]
MNKIEQLLHSGPSRRSFLAGAGALGAAAIVTGCNSDSGTAVSPTTPTTPPALDLPDNDVLNFALNLEYLEAEFYLRAATGSGISSADGGSGTVVGGTAVPGFTAAQAAYANEIAQAELNHVRFIRAAISGNSGTPVGRPNLDFTNSFNALATAAGIGPMFNPFLNPTNFLIGAFIFEDVGVTAYNGAAPLLSSNTLLTAAASIMAVEAYHAAELRSRIVATSIGGDNTYLNYANQIIALRSTLGGGNETVLSQTSIVAANSNAIAYARNTSQVLHIVYGTGGGAGVSKGGFFPNGMNGVITTTAS